MSEQPSYRYEIERVHSWGFRYTAWVYRGRAVYPDRPVDFQCCWTRRGARRWAQRRIEKEQRGGQPKDLWGRVIVERSDS